MKWLTSDCKGSYHLREWGTHTHTHSHLTLSLYVCNVSTLSDQNECPSGFTFIISVSPRCLSPHYTHKGAHTTFNTAIGRECQTKLKRVILGPKGKTSQAINCKSRVHWDHWMMDAGYNVCVYWGFEFCPWHQSTGGYHGSRRTIRGSRDGGLGHSVITNWSSLLWFPLLAPSCLPLCATAYALVGDDSLHGCLSPWWWI